MLVHTIRKIVRSNFAEEEEEEQYRMFVERLNKSEHLNAVMNCLSTFRDESIVTEDLLKLVDFTERHEYVPVVMVRDGKYYVFPNLTLNSRGFYILNPMTDIEVTRVHLLYIMNQKLESICDNPLHEKQDLYKYFNKSIEFDSLVKVFTRFFLKDKDSLKETHKERIYEIEEEYKPFEISVANTKEEIAWVYNNGPSSCMKNNSESNKWDSRYKGEVLPTDFYGYNKNTSVLYAKKGEKVFARCVLWDLPDGKRYRGIIYSCNRSAQLVLKRYLEENIYQYLNSDGVTWCNSMEERFTLFDACVLELPKFKVEKDKYFPLPYIDGSPPNDGGDNKVIIMESPEKDDHVLYVPSRSSLYQDLSRAPHKTHTTRVWNGYYSEEYTRSSVELKRSLIEVNYKKYLQNVN